MGKMINLLRFWRFVRKDSRVPICLKCLVKLQIGLDQVALQQDFQSLGKAFGRLAVYFTYVFEGV